MAKPSGPAFTLPASPEEYWPGIPSLQDTDPASATEVFNPLFQQLVTNIHAVKLRTDFTIRITFDENYLFADFRVSAGDFVAGGSVPLELTVDITVPKGNTSYLISIPSAGTNKSVEVLGFPGVYPVFVGHWPDNIREASWSQISAASINNAIPDSWQVGDEIDIELEGAFLGEVLTLQIYGKFHDVLPGDDNSTAGLTFGLKNLMTDVRFMDMASTNSGGFSPRALYNFLNNDIFNALPEGLRSVIRPVVKKTSAGIQSTEVLDETMALFCFSSSELYGSPGPYAVHSEGSMYPIFTDIGSRIKKLSNGSHIEYDYWLRSPVANSNTDFVNVQASGSPGYKGASSTSGVCFGFCI